MAFAATGVSTNFNRSPAAGRIITYTTSDNKATVQGNGYFPASAGLQADDLVCATCGDGTTTFLVLTGGTIWLIA